MASSGESADAADPDRAGDEAVVERPAQTSATVRHAWLVAGGIAVATAFLVPSAGLLAWLGLVPLFRLAPRARSVRAGALDGLVVGLAIVVPAFFWLVGTIHRFGGIPLPLALVVYALFAVFSACQLALVGAWLRFAGPTAALLLAPAVWTAIEFLFPNLFPWRLGQSQRSVPLLMQVGDLTGPFGLSFVMAWLAAALAQLRARALVAPLLATLAILAYGAWRSAEVRRVVAAAPSATIGIVQGNLSLDEKRHEELFESNVSRYRELSRTLTPVPDAIVWPETVVEWGIPHEGLPEGGGDPFPDATVPLVFGAVSYRRIGEADVDWFNSAFLRTTDGGLAARYDKIVLMPFGEFLPLASVFPWIAELSPATGDFTAGTLPVVLEVTPELRLGPLICYEDIYAGLVRTTVDAGANVLLTLANLAWFGAYPAPQLHESLALWRAIETRRYLVVSTNTGLSSVVSPLGEVDLVLPPEREAAAIAQVRPLELETVYQRHGDVFAWCSLVLAIGLTGLARRRRTA